MNTFAEAFRQAGAMLVAFDADLIRIVALSLYVSGSAVVLGGLVGMPLGAALALAQFPGRGAAIVALNAMLGLPPVVVGLVFYLLLSRAGPLGSLGLLFTPTAMVCVQTALVAPIIAALAQQTIAEMYEEYREQLQSLGVSRTRAVFTLLWDARLRLVLAALAGFGRASAEVGGIIIVGGNISGVTRVMTTTIALETSKGELALALALGIVLMTLVLAVTAATEVARRMSERRAA